MIQTYIGRKPNLYDSKVIIENGKPRLVRRHYNLQVIKTRTGNKMLKKYIDGDLEKVKVK